MLIHDKDKADNREVALQFERKTAKGRTWLQSELEAVKALRW